MNWKLISWASKFYWPVQDRLAKSIRNFPKVSAYLVRDTRQPGWQEATQYKPTFLYSHLAHLPEGDSLVWVDSDATIERFPEMFDLIESDIAFTNFTGNGRDEYLTGTLFLRKTERTRNFMKLWLNIQASDFEEGNMLREQVCFKRAVQESKDLLVHFLPLSYTCIHDHPSSPKNPHIVHWQASRTLRAQTYKDQ